MPVTTPNNAEIAGRFELLADLLELDGAVAYRYLAYRKAAKTLRETPESVARLSEQGRLRELPGVGAAVADKVAELLDTGNISALEKLESVTPPGVVPVMHIPGIGPKTARRIFADLGLVTLEDAVQAAREGRIRDLPGMGEKTEQAILAGAESAVSGRARISVARLRPLAENVRDALLEVPAVDRCEIAGSLRRYAETAKDIDLVASTGAPAEVVDAFVAYDWVASVEQRGETKATCIAHDGTRVELRMVAPGTFGNLLQHLTGSKAHNVALREDAVRRGLKVSEYGVEEVETGELLQTDDEHAVYERLGMAWIPPELREHRGELEAARAATLPQLVEVEQIRGDLHCAHRLERRQGDARGDGRRRDRHWATATSTSPTTRRRSGSGWAWTPAGCARRSSACGRWPRRCAPDFVLLVGCEVDILRDGSLDYSDALLEPSWTSSSPASTRPTGCPRPTRPSASARRWRTRTWTCSATPPAG